MLLTSFLNSRGFHQFEGYSQEVPEQVKHMNEITSSPNIRVLEIGFNAGHSSEVFLRNNPTLTVTSFDLGEHNYTFCGKQYLDYIFPGRHTLILGNSIHSLPTYISNNVDKKFDVIFIDGGHTYSIVKSDLENCVKLAHKDTIVIMDDTVYKPEWHLVWNEGPTTVWTESLAKNEIVEINRVDYSFGRGMSWGKYNSF